ncbi:class I SAM-dependent methyltransferase [Pontiellaceae bacterium B12227]|nr:class I SAM-dependent methyltransferase [Pontiellaceae bacterium B12227]
MASTSEHWNNIYQDTEECRLGWYEDHPSTTLELLNQIPGWENTTIFLPGAGTSLLVDYLLDAGARLVLNDLSSVALRLLKERLGDRGVRAEWICQNIAYPLGASVAEVDIWIDRAVLHFLTDEHDIGGCFRNIRTKLKVGGHALFAEFLPNGVSRCADLELHGYSLEELLERLGEDFEPVDHFEHTYIGPDGESRPYIYSLFKRVA